MVVFSREIAKIFQVQQNIGTWSFSLNKNVKIFQALKNIGT